MSNVISNTVSALFASQLRVSTAANNIANAATPGYQAEDVDQTSNGDGGVNAQVVTRNPGAVQTINQNGDPEELPNVDLDQEIVNSQIASYDFKANATVLQTQQQLQKQFLDILA